MPPGSGAVTQVKEFAAPEQVACRRIFRLTVGVSLSLLFSQAINWPLSFIAPIFTLLILGLPLPAPTFKTGLKFVLALLFPVYVGAFILIPFIEHAHAVSILLITLALFASFYYTAQGGSAIMGMFMTVGLTIIIAVGSVSLDALLAITNGLAIGAISGMVFVWAAHAILPELAMKPARGAARAKQAPPSAEDARKSALRSMLIVLPIATFFLFSSSSAAYVAMMIKVATMGQQANSDDSHQMGRDQIESTLWGGLAAIIAWQLMSIWSSLLMYGFVIVLSGLWFGPRIFVGNGMHPRASMWSYAFMTMIIVLAPALLDGLSADGASVAFYDRLLLFVIIAIYGSVVITVFDAFWSFSKESKSSNAV